MRLRRISIALGLTCLIGASPADTAPAVVQAPTGAKLAREKFAKLLLADGPKRSAKVDARRRGVVVNAFGATKIHIH